MSAADAVRDMRMIMGRQLGKQHLNEAWRKLRRQAAWKSLNEWLLKESINSPLQKYLPPSDEQLLETMVFKPRAVGPSTFENRAYTIGIDPAAGPGYWVKTRWDGESFSVESFGPDDVYIRDTSAGQRVNGQVNVIESKSLVMVPEGSKGKRLDLDRIHAILERNFAEGVHSLMAAMPATPPGRRTRTHCAVNCLLGS